MEAEVMEVEIDRIVIGPNRRELDMSFVEELAKSIEVSGLMNPITVNKEFVLIAGLHRLEAEKMLGHKKIRCTVLDLDELRSELAEIDENFMRSPLTEREKCIVLARRKQIYEELHPETKHGGDHMSAKSKIASCNLAPEAVKTFAQDAAEKLGVSEASVSRRVRIGEKVTPEAMAVFDKAEKKFNQREALRLTHIAPEHQKEAAEQYVAGKITSISDYQSGEEAPAKAQRAKRQRSGKSPPVRTADRDAEEPPKPTAKADEPEPPIPQTDSPGKGTRKLPTIQELAANLKDVDRERPLTSDMFVSEFGSAVDDLIEHIDWFGMKEYLDVFSDLSMEQYQFLRDKQQSVQTRMERFLELIRGKIHT